MDLIKKFEAGFIAGATAVNPDIEILSQYVSQPPDFNGFNDSAKGKEIATAMYADGADVVYHAAGATGLGVFEAAKEAGEPGSVWAIGVDSDQYNQVSADLQPYILTSMLKRVNVAVYETIKAYVEDNVHCPASACSISLLTAWATPRPAASSTTSRQSSTATPSRSSPGRSSSRRPPEPTSSAHQLVNHGAAARQPGGRSCCVAVLRVCCVAMRSAPMK